MKVLFIGDPHGNVTKLRKISKKDVDLIIVTGDLGKADLARKQAFANFDRKKKGLPPIEDDPKIEKAIYKEIHESTMAVLKYLSQFAPVYTIQGNVGAPTKGEVNDVKKKLGIKINSTIEDIKKMKDTHMVKNQKRVVDGLKVGFLEYYVDASWVKEFKPSDYARRMKKARKETEKAKKVLKRFGSDIDVLICHQPPFGVLDKVNFPGAPKQWQNKRAGGKAILDYVKKYQPKYVFCGHIHEGEGKKKIGKSEVYNLGVCGYKIVHF